LNVYVSLNPGRKSEYALKALSSVPPLRGSTSITTSESHTIPMFASGHLPHHSSICSGSAVALFCHALIRGRFPALQRFLPQEHLPSRMLCKGNIRRPCSLCFSADDKITLVVLNACSLICSVFLVAASTGHFLFPFTEPAPRNPSKYW
jgi:hypothetical protein